MVPKSFKLKIYWSQKEKDFMILSPRSSDGHFAHSAILAPRLMTMFKSSWKEHQAQNDEEYRFRHEDSGNSNIVHVEWLWIEELGRRGFDLSTLKFEITIKKEELAKRFVHLWEDLSDAEKAEAIRLGFAPPSEKKED